jgi:hypothetical protein
VSSFTILRGQDVRWRLRLQNGETPVDMAGGFWGVAETAFKILPTFEDGASEAWLVWTAAQTAAMSTGRKRLRLKFTQANGQVKVYPDVFISVQ